MNLTNNQILEDLNKYVYGHLKTKKALINTFRRSRLRWEQYITNRFEESELLETSNLLLIGESGTGKTYLVKQLAHILKMPLVYIDATELTHTGGAGGLKVADIIHQIDKYAEDYFKQNGGQQYPSIQAVISQLIIFVDEFDKIAGSTDSSSTGNWNIGTQHTFLKLFENSLKYKSITWIFAGAFTNLDYNKLKKSIGFIQNPEKTINTMENLDNALLKFGIIPEMLGRISSISLLDTFKKEDYWEILQNILLPKKYKDLIYLGYENIPLSVEQGDQIITMAMKSHQGVRALKRNLDEFYAEYEFNFENTYKYKTKLAVPNKNLTANWTDEQWHCFSYGTHSKAFYNAAPEEQKKMMGDLTDTNWYKFNFGIRPNE